MKVLISLIAITASLSIATAGDRNSAYNLVCKPMTFESEKNECVSRIKNYSYFDDAALNICKNVTFNSNKINCLDMIGNKVYEAYEMDVCVNQTFESKKLECLQQNGTQYDPTRPVCVSREVAIADLRSGIANLRAGNSRNADVIFSTLLNKFQSCNQ